MGRGRGRGCRCRDDMRGATGGVDAPRDTALRTMAGRFATATGCSVADRVPPPRNGDGRLSDHGIERIVLDLRVHRILEGTNENMRVNVARGLMGVFG
ncbi:acyl-CoA dehydrogenase family protein [Streptomyces sp. NPDC051639]|uniref:acyl-CoA dehydrogenase family protein n=1 Tax=Streptomyces sp. NPDC051639 TaxID=3155671 RepID=UPI003438360C